MSIAWLEENMVAVVANSNATDAPSNYLHCDRTNFRGDELKKEWTGAMVLPEYFEGRQPQEYVKARGSQRDKGPQNPEPTDVWITTKITQDDL